MNDRHEYEEARRMRERITNPEAPKPKPLAVKVKQGGKLYAGKARQENELILVWPEEMPPGFISKDQARELVESGLCAIATEAEIEAFLAENEPA